MKNKKLFQYIGVLSLAAFSFYYANKVAIFFNKEDIIMKQIGEYASKNNTECLEGYITEEGVVLGIAGKKVNENLSYSKMLGSEFNESLIEFLESECIVSKKNNIDDYIIGGNEFKNSVSLIIKLTNGKSVDKILEISKMKNVNLSFIVNYNYFIYNQEIINKIISSGNDILYNGNNLSELNEMQQEFKNIVCINDEFDNKDMCSKRGVNTIRVSDYFNTEYLNNIKKSVKKGKFIVLEENNLLKKELGVLINYIKSKGIKVINVNDHIK